MGFHFSQKTKHFLFSFFQNALVFINHKFVIYLLLFLIFAYGTYLRTINLENTAAWFGDSGRDVLVAKHLAEYREGFLVAPHASRGNGLIKNTPFYFWILGLSWLISGSEDGVIFLFSLFGAVNIILAFLIFKQFCSDYRALFFAYLVSISSVLINFSRNIWQPNLLPFFQLASILFYIKGLKKNWYFYLSTQFAFLALHIHFSYLPILLATLLLVIRILFKKKEKIKMLLFLLLVSINCFVWLFLSGSIGILKIFESKTVSLPANFLTLIGRLPSNLAGNIYELGVNSFFSSDGLELFYFFLLLFLVGALVRMIRNSVGDIREVSVMLIAMVGTFFVLGLYEKPLPFHYLYHYYILFWLAISFVILKIKGIGGLLIIPLLFFVSVKLGGNNAYLTYNRQISEKEQSEHIARVILNSGKFNRKYIKLCANDGNNCSNYDSFTSNVWFFIEKLSGKRFGFIANIGNGNNYAPYFEDADNKDFFAVCQYELKKCAADLKIDFDRVEVLSVKESVSVIYYHYQK